MRYGSVCSGIEAASVAWPDWECAFVAEVEPFASAVLQHRYPAVPNLGDITQEDFCDRATTEAGPIDVLIGGTPCQSFSIAGTRGGLDDPRGQLSLAFVEIVNRLRPRYVIWENVPGVLSSGGGRDFGAFIGALADVGYRLAYRILDAQYFGVAQRRKRVFVVGCTGDGDPAEILALREGLSGDPAPCREAGEDLARPLAGRTGGSRQDLDNDTYVTDMRGNGDGQVVPTLVGDHLNRPTDYTPMVADEQQVTSKANRTQPTEDHAPPLTQAGRHLCWPEVAMPCMHRDHKGPRNWQDGGLQVTASPTPTTIRRLTPRECERLQGFPDDWTLIPWTHGKPAADTPRYKAIGNSMAVPVIRWIGERIECDIHAT